MKITYNEEGYQIFLEYPEIEIYINANNIVDARKHFIDMMAFAFDSTVNNQFYETSNKVLDKVLDEALEAVKTYQKECDHRWEWQSSSSLGDSTYRCIKCGVLKKSFPDGRIEVIKDSF